MARPINLKAKPRNLLARLEELEAKCRLISTRGDGLGEERKELQGSLYLFAKAAWGEIDPNDWVDSWHLVALAEHLELVYKLENDRPIIPYIVINIPPRCGKSIMCNVFFCAWVWAKDPSATFFYTSYSYELAKKHGLMFRDLIKSEWYQARWGHKFQLTKDTERSIKNSKLGERFISSIGGSGTGFGASYIFCFPYDTLVKTEIGPIPIGEIVEKKLDVKVWSTNTKTGHTELKPIVDHYKNPGNDILEITFNDGSVLKCTPEHKIWTTKGWCRADRLIPNLSILPDMSILDSFDMPSTDPESSCKSNLHICRIKDFFSLIKSKFTRFTNVPPISVVGQSISFGNVSPVLSDSNVSNNSRPDFISLCKDRWPFIAFSNFNSQFLSKFSSRPFFVHGESSMSLGIRDVFASSSIAQVIKTIVARVTVKMPDFMLKWPWPYKSEHQSDMSKHTGHHPIFIKIVDFISLVVVNLKNRFLLPILHRSWHMPSHNESTDTLHSSEGRNFVVLKSGNKSPLFIRNIGHVSSTYCLNIQDYHTFYTTNSAKTTGYILVSNCDDPLDAVAADSEAERDKVIQWWSAKMSSRWGRAGHMRKVIIMQRLHEMDLSGYVLADGIQGLVHLCLPMEYEPKRKCRTIPLPSTGGKLWQDPRTKEGELLWPNYITKDLVEQLKKGLKTEYAISGQLQQRPAPESGSFIKKDWFQWYKEPNLPDCHFILSSWDTAISAEPGRAYSANVVFGIFKDRFDIDNVILLSMWSGRVEYPDLRMMVQRLGRNIYDTDIDDPLPPGKAYEMKPDVILIEAKANGLSLIQDLKAAGVPNIQRYDPKRSFDKMGRARLATALLQNGIVWVPAKAPLYKDLLPFADKFVEACALFPNAESNDIVDAMSQAIDRIRAGGLVRHTDNPEEEYEFKKVRKLY
jgi:predicted phage terminase large subunit-like protein